MKFPAVKRILAVLCVMVLCLSGCGSQPSGTTGAAAPSVSAPTVSAEEEAVYQLLFDWNSHVQIQIHMDESEIAKMQADYEAYSSRGSKSPIYRMADVDIVITAGDGETCTYRIEQVGVRMKGNTSRCSFYRPQDGIYNLIHLKLSFQETFDNEEYYGSDALQWTEEARKERKNRTFAGLEKLDLKWNRCDDPTYIREHYAYEMYRDYGVLAPRTTLASVDWAGIHAGVFTVYEPIDKIFLARNLPESQLGGDLYKCGWTNVGASFTSTGSIGIEDEDAGAFYVYDLQTNKKSSQHEALVNLIDTLNSGAVTKEQFAELVEVDSFLNYAAISYILGNPDDLRNNYNNFYLYFLPDSGKAIIIPYDYDRCLGVTNGYNPNGNGMTLDDPFSTTMAATGDKQENPLFIYSVDAGGYYVREYAEKLARIAQSQWVTAAYFETVYQTAMDHYQNETLPGKSFHNAGGHRFTFDLAHTSDPSSQGNLSFADYISAKTATLSQALANLDSYLNAAPSVPANYYIRGEFNDWSVRDGYEMRLDENSGAFTYQISGTGTIRLKVYSKKDDDWFGSECIPADSFVAYDTDDHTNIILAPGTYTIRFDPDTQEITIDVTIPAQ